jgi:hypothetical protein
MAAILWPLGSRTEDVRASMEAHGVRVGECEAPNAILACPL